MSALEYFLSLFDVIIHCDREIPTEAGTPEESGVSLDVGQTLLRFLHVAWKWEVRSVMSKEFNNDLQGHVEVFLRID